MNFKKKENYWLKVREIRGFNLKIIKNNEIMERKYSEIVNNLLIELKKSIQDFIFSIFYFVSFNIVLYFCFQNPYLVSCTRRLNRF